MTAADPAVKTAGDYYAANIGNVKSIADFVGNYRLLSYALEAHGLTDQVVTTNVGQALQKAMRGIERANPETLYGIFGDAAWSNKDRLPDSLLRDLIEHFSSITLGNAVAQADVPGTSNS